MLNFWKSGLLASLHLPFLSATQRSFDLFPDLNPSLEHEQGPKSPFLVITEQKKPLETLMLFDKARVGLEAGGEIKSKSFRYAPVREIGDIEAYSPASKKQKSALNLSLGLPVYFQNPSNFHPGSSITHSQILHQSDLTHRLEMPKELEGQTASSGHRLKGLKNDQDIRNHPKDGKTIGSAITSHSQRSIKTIYSQNNGEQLPTNAQDRFRDTITDIHPAQTTSMRNIEMRLGENFNPQVESQFWAWMSIILDHLEGSAGGEFEDNVPHTMTNKKLLVAYFNHKVLLGKKTPEKVCENYHLKLRFRRIARLLWVTNFQILHTLGIKKSGVDYLAEQKALQEWFLKFLQRSKKQSKTVDK
ncbi:hypothetical protein PGTUg99_017750 [Puccinia graminis f. sp. tritici]|uniref:Uncharacterized protein n=1 Tax=Puccinia graminis f. sp. tritici TaxID=56615 RepID=A0A5B0LKU7_PUCGR|nr:hypothetical protein PGTUg99_017750 [Puccinia graminis f. sp. tritici]